MSKRKLQSLTDLTPDDRNANRGTERGLGMLENSLRTYGAGRSIVLDKNGKIIAGNKTVQSAVEMGLTKLEIVQTTGNTVVAVQRMDLDMDTDPKARELAIADNRVGELDLDWDPEALAELGTELDLSKFWTMDELGELLGAEGAGGAVDGPDAHMEAAEALQGKWGAKRGDVWEIGRHRLMCGDSLKSADVATLVDGAEMDLLITSPPYNQSIDSFKPSGMHKEGQWVSKVGALAYADSLPEATYQAQQASGLNVWFAVMRDRGSAFYNHKNRYRGKEVVSPLKWLPGPFKLRQEIIWSRPGSVTQNARMFLPSDERIYWLYKGDDFDFNDSTEIKTFSTVWDIALEANLTHAVGFPIALPTRCMRACSESGSRVIDPYCGSGTTIVAAEQMGRSCYGMEIEPKFCSVILERMSDMGLEPKCLSVKESTPVKKAARSNM